MNTIKMQSARVHYNPGIILFFWGLLSVLVAAIAITEAKWIYLGLIAAPFIIYVSLTRPFIFPFGIYVFSIPFENLLVLSGAAHGATLNRLMGIMTILVLALKCLFEKKLIVPDKITLWWVLFAAYCFLSVTWAIDPELPVVRIQSIVGFILFYLVVSSYRVQEKEYETLLWCILLGGALSALLTVYGYQKAIELGSAGRVSLMSIKDTGSVVSINKQAFDMLLPVSICLGMLVRKQTSLARTFLFVTLVTLCFSIILTGSRGSTAGCLGILATFFFLSKKKVSFGMFAVVILLILASLTPQFFVDRLNNAVGSHADGRADIWYVGWKAMAKYWLHGAGLDSFPAAYTEFMKYAPYMGQNRAPHNIFVGMSVELGIIGIFFMIMALVKHYTSLVPKGGSYDNDQIILKAAFWGIIIASLSFDSVWFKSFWLLWMMITMQKNIAKAEERDFPVFCAGPRHMAFTGKD